VPQEGNPACKIVSAVKA